MIYIAIARVQRPARLIYPYNFKCYMPNYTQRWSAESGYTATRIIPFPLGRLAILYIRFTQSVAHKLIVPNRLANTCAIGKTRPVVSLTVFSSDIGYFPY